MIRTKNRVVYGLLLVMILTLVSGQLVCVPATPAAGIRVLIDGKVLAADQSPFIEEGRVLVPFRALFEAIGATVSWDARTRTVTGSKGNRTVGLVIGQKTARINNESVTLDVPAKIVHGRTFVPLRFVSESLGAKVDWDAGNRTVIIVAGTAGGLTVSQKRINVPEYFYGKRGFLELKSNTVRVSSPPRRVVVLWPYTTELLKTLGAEKSVIAVCDNAKEKEWPPYVKRLPTVGKGYQPSVEKILALRPDLVVGYIKPGSAIRTQLEREGIPCLNIWGYHPPLLSKEVQTLGLVFERRAPARELAGYIDKWLNLVQERTKKLSSKQRPKVYWEWGETPWKSVGPGSTGDLYIKWAGGRNIAPEQGTSWPVVSPEWVAAQNPDVVIKCVSAPNSGWEGDKKALEKIRKELINRPALRNSNAVKNGRVYLIDGMVMYGPREVVGLCYLAKWLHPQLFRDIDPEAVHREMLKKFYGEELKGVWVYPPLK